MKFNKFSIVLLAMVMICSAFIFSGCTDKSYTLTLVSKYETPGMQTTYKNYGSIQENALPFFEGSVFDRNLENSDNTDMDILVGWYTSQTYETRVEFPIDVSSLKNDMSIYAKWVTANKITLYKNGEVDGHAFGADGIKIQSPGGLAFKKGYDCLGIYDAEQVENNETVPSSAKNYYGVDSNGLIISNGFVFNGTEDVNIYVWYKAKDYQISFDLNGGSFSNSSFIPPKNIKFGDEIINYFQDKTVLDFSKEGEVFQGFMDFTSSTYYFRVSDDNNSIIKSNEIEKFSADYNVVLTAVWR